MTTIPIIAIVLLHVIMHGIDVGWGKETLECMNSSNPMCGTPISGFFEIGREESTEFGNSVQGRLPLVGELAAVWGFVQAFTSLLTGAFLFNYAWLKGDAWLIRLVLWLIQTVLGIVFGVMLVNLILSGLRR